MDEGSGKKIRRKKGNKKSRQESDIELGAETTSDTTGGKKDDVWIEQENVTDEKLKKREKNRKENVNYFFLQFTHLYNEIKFLKSFCFF